MFHKLKTKFTKNKKKSFCSKKKYVNPYFKKKKNPLIKIPSFSLRTKITILSILIIIIGLIFLIFFSPIFNIKSIIVDGAIKISTEEIKKIALDQTRDHWGYEKNIFLFNKKKLIKKINEKYNLDDLVIKKRLLNKLIINFHEKQQAIIWFEADKYYYADIVGSIINEVGLLDISQKDIPLLYNSGDAKIVNKSIKINSNKIKFILDLFSEFKDKRDTFEIERFNIDNEEGTVGLKIVNGPVVYFNIKDDLTKQINKFNILISQKLKDSFSKQHYIDLRYGDKIYYQ